MSLGTAPFSQANTLSLTHSLCLFHTHFLSLSLSLPPPLSLSLFNDQMSKKDTEEMDVAALSYLSLSLLRTHTLSLTLYFSPLSFSLLLSLSLSHPSFSLFNDQMSKKDPEEMDIAALSYLSLSRAHTPSLYFSLLLSLSLSLSPHLPNSSCE